MKKETTKKKSPSNFENNSDKNIEMSNIIEVEEDLEINKEKSSKIAQLPNENPMKTSQKNEKYIKTDLEMKKETIKKKSASNFESNSDKNIEMSNIIEVEEDVEINKEKPSKIAQLPNENLMKTSQKNKK